MRRSVLTLDDAIQITSQRANEAYNPKDVIKPWREQARPEQLPPDGEWRTWLLMAGRGFGKTRSGAELVKEWIESGERYVNLMAPTFADGRDVMVEGESGLYAVAYDLIDNWNRSMGEIRWKSGARSRIFSSDAPERMRGPQSSKIWGDEPGAWQNAQEFWDMAMFGLRLGDNPQIVLTTTPRPIPLIKYILRLETTVITRGKTRDNYENLAPGIVDDLEKRYAGTRLGLQELDGILLEDNPGALWRREWLNRDRIRGEDKPQLVRIVVSIDPAVSNSEDSDETGIITAGIDRAGHFYILSDRSGRHTPKEWASIACSEFHRWGASCIVAEVNNGGNLVASNVHTVERLPIREVRAKVGKKLRAQPVASLYEQGKVHHVGHFEALEDQQCTWDPALDDDSPDRVDAKVYAIYELDPSVAIESTKTKLSRFDKKEEKWSPLRVGR